ncbi:MAG TPA: GNAT family protein [Kofleriaceae bacterium]|nr:GNAT family protein [Kofleriaceae bacterium]
MTESFDDLALLALQIGGVLDTRGRIAGRFGITLASGGDGQALWIGAEVPEPLARELAAAFDQAPRPVNPGDPPPALERCAQLLAAAGGGDALERAAGPSYVFPPGARLASEAADAAIIASDAPAAERARIVNPGNWEPIEWDELIAGQLGPWTIAVDGARAISICHTPGPLTERAAECGVWTDPAYRGRGLAAATAAAWLPLVRTPDRRVFYSTEFTNVSSQRVAQRLQLRPIGWTWRLYRPLRGAGLHPLCSLARTRQAASQVAIVTSSP